MKRINLSVDLEDNQILEDSIIEAIKKQASQISRESINEVLVAEIDRIVDSKIKDVKDGPYWGSVTSRITDVIVNRLSKEIHLESFNIDDLIQNKVGEYLDRKIESRGGLDKYIQHYIDKSIATLLIEKSNN